MTSILCAWTDWHLNVRTDGHVLESERQCLHVEAAEFRRLRYPSVLLRLSQYASGQWGRLRDYECRVVQYLDRLRVATGLPSPSQRQYLVLLSFDQHNVLRSERLGLCHVPCTSVYRPSVRGRSPVSILCRGKRLCLSCLLRLTRVFFCRRIYALRNARLCR